MKAIIFIISVLFFLFVLYKLIKDDHVFLRRNLKLEHVFDIVFILLGLSLILGKIHLFQTSLFLNNISLSGSITLLIFGKYKKISLGRIFDFFVLSFLPILPFIYVTFGLISKKGIFVQMILSSFFYLILSVLFFKYLYKKLINRTIKEGTIANLFFMIFSLFSFIQLILNLKNIKALSLNSDVIYLLLLFIINFVLFIRQIKTLR